ncbi:MAG: secretion system protein E, partial [Candidatus Bathyarchaeia archaeon]
MKFKLKPGKRNKNQEENASKEPPVETLLGYLGLKRRGAPEGYIEVEAYPLKPPFSYASIVRNEATAELLYIVDELPLEKEEKEAYDRMKNVLEYELKAPEGEESLSESFHRQLPIIAANHPKTFMGISPIGIRKIQYYLERNIVGYGKIDPLMHDPYVEDVSCGGISKPIFLWHRVYENIKTNIFFNTEEELNDFVMKMVHKAGKHVSIA